VPVNCTALPDALLESELFGHVRGAFTGATATRRGLFAEADGGTLFLDEIGDMDLGLQAKVLRAVDDGEIRAVGADSPRRTDVRLIAATNQDLESRVKEGRFRTDLFYRLNVVPVLLPPLRSRPEDIPILIERFLDEARQRNPNSPVRELTAQSVARLSRLTWPGNVRELENLIERVVVVGTKPVLDVTDFEELAPGLLDEPSPELRACKELLPLRQVEAEYIEWVIDRCGGNTTRAAEILGVDVSTIHRRRRGGSHE
jgi:two-component system response regulator HydG